MKVSIFKDLTFATGIDYSYTPPQEGLPASLDEYENPVPEVLGIPSRGHPDCVACIDVDFDPQVETLEITEKKGKYKADVVPLPDPPESEENKKHRIVDQLINSDDPMKVDTEGVTGFNADSMILARFFKGNRGSEMGFTQKFVYLQALPKRSAEQDTELTLITEKYLEKEAYKNYIISL